MPTGVYKRIKPVSEETKKKISESNKGKKRPKHTDEWKKNQSKRMKGNKYSLGFKHSEEFCKNNGLRVKGDKCHFWKGGITPEDKSARQTVEYKFWRKSCMIRDNFICQKTGISGGNLIVHHINNFSSFPELRYEITNGITLSHEAHMEFHNKYGRQNNTLEQLNEFLNAK